VSVKEKLSELGLTLPTAAAPVAAVLDKQPGAGS